jgi:CRP/FNR family cyclic AMP-dependent transcriptional regulator
MERLVAEQASYGFRTFSRQPHHAGTSQYCPSTGDYVPLPYLSPRSCRIDRVPAAECDRRELPTRTTIYFEGDPVQSLHFVDRGKLKLSLSSHRGHSVIVRFASPGDFLGLSAVLSHATHEFMAETVKPTSLITVTRNAFLRLLRHSREVNALTTWALARDYQEMLRGIRRLGISNCVSGRLAQLLLNYLDAAGRTRAGMSFRMDLTRDELATMVNTTRETVTRIMRQFVRDELIALDGDSLVILNPVRLQLLAG